FPKQKKMYRGVTLGGRLSAKLVLAKVQPKPRNTAGKDKSENQKVQTKQKIKGAEGKQRKVINQGENEDDLPVENEEIKNEGVPVSDSAGKREAKY
uniref:Uncharacterized protein n=1 Tax=Vombatus ursinus TaxID=29139 RepID=A0A4X2KJZ1_VOMUR